MQFLSVAQNPEMDSLKKVLAVSKIDSNLYDANRLMAADFWEIDTDSALMYGNRALAIAKKIKDPAKVAMGYQVIGVSYDYKDNLDSCLKYLNDGLAVYRSINRPDGESHILSDIAIAYYFRGNYELALRNHLSALELRQKFGNKRFIAVSYNNIGLVYRSRKEYGNAALYYQKSLAIKKEINDEQGILNSLLNVGSAFQSEGKYDSALVIAREAITLAKKINAANDLIAAEVNQGAALVNLGRYGEALPILKEVEKKSVENNYRNLLYSVYESLGDIYAYKEEFNEADKYYRKGLELTKKGSRMEQESVFYRKLAKNAFNNGNYKQSYEFLELSKNITDTLLNEENSRQINEMAAVYEVGEKEKRIEKLNGDNQVSIALAQRRKNERNYFILASVLFLGMAVLAYRAFTANKRKKEQLAVQNAVIEKALHEKEFLMKEIHHRVKNNLQVISSLLNLQSHYIKDEQALEAVKDSRNRVQSMALIHQNLYQEDNLTGIDVNDYAGKLCDNLFQSYNIHPSRIKLIKEIEPINLDVDTVIPLGLILNELVTNSLKYAFPGDKTGAIKIELKEAEHILTLKVYDNGIGLPDDFETRYKTTFGYKMINAFIQKLKGQMKIFTDEGAKVEITLTNYKLSVV
ncbi:MAG: histidine kinase dimerization/phosphoacceptor domain -containing protein [Ferruginibacter sp.]